MNSPKKYSVIIPTYNSSPTIIRALESVKCQILKPYEIIIIDDGSADYEELKIKVNNIELTGIKINLLQNVNNLNGAVTRNRGINFAGGDFIAFLDADDEWEDDKIYRFDQEVNLYGMQYVYFSQVSVFHDDVCQLIRPLKAPPNSQDISEYLFLDGGFIQTSTIVISREIAKRIKFDERFIRHQDYDFCLRAAKYYNFRMLKAPLTRYHVTGNQYKLKSEDSDYCLWWLQEMKPYMSNFGYYGYLLFPFSARLLLEKKYIRMLSNIFRALIGLGLKGVISCRGKLVDVFR